MVSGYVRVCHPATSAYQGCWSCSRQVAANRRLKLTGAMLVFLDAGGPRNLARTSSAEVLACQSIRGGSG
jgi:hypothetical protein